MTKEERQIRAQRRAQLKRGETMMARKLAASDFNWMNLTPDQCAVICRIDPDHAKKLRKHEVYLATLQDLEQEMMSTIKKDTLKETDRLRFAFSQLVPKAVQVMEEHLEGGGLLALQASREVLDRDGRMPKVSRVQTTFEEKTGLADVDDKVVDEFKTARVQ